MATGTTFQLNAPVVDVEADAALAATRSTKAPAIFVVATRHEITAVGIETVLHAAGHRVVARCSSEDSLVGSLDVYRPDIILLAQNIVGREATRTVSQLRARNYGAAIIFLLEEHVAITASDLLDFDMEGILLSGACATSLIDCVRSVHRGRKWIDPELLRQLAIADRSSLTASSLTSRENDIAHLISRGLHNKQIARELHLSEGTVKMHLHHIYEKLGLGGRTQLALSMASVGARKVSVT